MPILLGVLALAAIACFCILWLSAKKVADELEAKLEYAKSRMMPEDQLKEAQGQLETMRKRFDFEMEKERRKVRDAERIIAEDIEKSRRELNEINGDLTKARENRDLMDLGFRRREFTHADPASYQKAIETVEDQQATMLKGGLAAKCTMNWTIEGSEKKGEQMIGKLMKLALRAFNADADAAIARVTWKNVESMADRIRKSEETVEKTLDKWGIIIVDAYRNLKLKELQLTFERAEMDQKIKEEQKALREQQKEEERARREAEAAEREAEREERRVMAALEKAKQEMSAAHTADLSKHVSRIQELEAQLDLAIDKRKRAISLSQITKAGNVYVISNIGSFGPTVLKIGMTRRMDPMDRVWELSDASVPFDFDVHAMIRTDDAPALESALHQRFDSHRVNLVNQRKEFFRVTIDQVQAMVSEMGHDVKLTLAAEAREHYETLTMRKEKG